MIKTVFFDMNETLLDLSFLKENFDKSFDNDYVLKYWFTKLLHTSVVVGAMDNYKNFGELAEVVLETVFFESGKELTEGTKVEILSSFRMLPAYSDVVGSINILKEKDIRVITVSNSSLQMIEQQLLNTGIIDLFDNYYSVDGVSKYKPFKDVYQYVANEENVSVSNIAMVASHDWDLFGAKKSGLITAYIKRKETIFNPYYPQPDISEDSLIDVANEIIKIK